MPGRPDGRLLLPVLQEGQPAERPGCKAEEPKIQQVQTIHTGMHVCTHLNACVYTHVCICVQTCMYVVHTCM